MTKCTFADSLGSEFDKSRRTHAWNGETFFQSNFLQNSCTSS